MSGGGGQSNHGGNTGDAINRRSPYAVLNLSPTVDEHGGNNNNSAHQHQHQPISDDKIRDSYKRLSRLLHPDKRPPGKEREDAQEIFIELQHACKFIYTFCVVYYTSLLSTYPNAHQLKCNSYMLIHFPSCCLSDEILVDPALRQAYDHFGFSAVVQIRQNKYGADSLYINLTHLHDEGKPDEALDLLQLVLEDSIQKKRRKEWEFDADCVVDMHACPEGGMAWPEVTSTHVSLMASVPMPPQQTAASPFPSQSSSDDNTTATSRRRVQNMQLCIGGQSNLENGMGSTKGILSANYKPLPHTMVSSDLTIGRKHLETSLSSNTQLANGTGLSAKVTRQYEPGSNKDANLGFGFSSNRTLSMFHGRTVHAMFALGVGKNLAMHYGVLSLTTWGFGTRKEEELDAPPPPRLTAKLTLGTSFPVECSIDQPHLFDAPHRSGKATVAWSPLLGYKLKAMICRNVSKRCGLHVSEFASTFGLGVEHTPLSGLKWMFQYGRPEGLTIKVPIFMASFMNPNYFNRVVWCSIMSFLIDETVEELMGNPTSSELDTAKQADATNTHKAVSMKICTNQNEQRWCASSKAKRNAERQLSIIAPIAKMKRDREESLDGLAILKATYSSPFVSLDVTQQLQFWVENSRLSLPPSSKSLLLGFYALPGSKASEDAGSDLSSSSMAELAHRWTCTINDWLYRLGVGGDDDAHCHNGSADNISNESVTLTVRYKYKGKVYEIRVDDNDPLQLPSSGATVLGSSDLVS